MGAQRRGQPRGKLRAAARALSAGRDGRADDAAAFGIETPAEPEPVWVLPENWPAVRAFLACLTQWRRGPSGHPTGLDYAGCRAAVAGIGLRWREVFEGLRTMEAETLRALSAPRKGRPER